MIISAALKLVGGLLVGPLFDYLKTVDQSKMTRETLAAEIQKNMTEAQSSIITAEINAEGWLQRNWRPVTALTAFFTYWFVIFLYPFLLAYGVLPAVRFGEVGLQNFWGLTLLCVGGYMGGRTIEKVAENVKSVLLRK